MKLTIYTQFEMKGVIENNRNFHWKINNRNEIKRLGIEIKLIQIWGTIPYFSIAGERK